MKEEGKAHNKTAKSCSVHWGDTDRMTVPGRSVTERVGNGLTNDDFEKEEV